MIKDEFNGKGSLIGRNHIEFNSSDDYSFHIINSPGTIGLDTSLKEK